MPSFEALITQNTGPNLPSSMKFPQMMTTSCHQNISLGKDYCPHSNLWQTIGSCKQLRRGQQLSLQWIALCLFLCSFWVLHFMGSLQVSLQTHQEQVSLNGNTTERFPVPIFAFLFRILAGRPCQLGRCSSKSWHLGPLHMDGQQPYLMKYWLDYQMSAQVIYIPMKYWPSLQQEDGLEAEEVDSLHQDGTMDVKQHSGEQSMDIESCLKLNQIILRWPLIFFQQGKWNPGPYPSLQPEHIQVLHSSKCRQPSDPQLEC